MSPYYFRANYDNVEVGRVVFENKEPLELFKVEQKNKNGLVVLQSEFGRSLWMVAEEFDAKGYLQELWEGEKF